MANHQGREQGRGSVIKQNAGLWFAHRQSQIRESAFPLKISDLGEKVRPCGLDLLLPLLPTAGKL